MLLNAKPYVEMKIAELKERLSKLDKTPKLAIIQVEGNKASDKYVENKLKRCAEVGIAAKLCYFGCDVSQSELEDKIWELNEDPEVTGILLQLPLPKHLDEQYLMNQILAYKDVDGLTNFNAGVLSQGGYCNIPCTPKGIIELLKFYNIPMEGQDVLIINDSNIVGKPLAQLFLREGATVTIAHKKTRNLKQKISQADIIATGVGIPNFLCDKDFYRGRTIIDISINFVDGKMRGDVVKEDYEAISRRCNLTPVPGGVGQTTVIALLDTLVELVERGF